MSQTLGMTLINGHPGEQVLASERALQYGDGLFETISCVDGRARWLAQHLQRLQHGCDRLRLPFQEFELLGREIAMLAQWLPRCIIKVIISRGAAARRGYRPSGEERPTRIVSRHEWPSQEGDSGPLRVGISGVQLGTNPLLAGLKHLNRLEQVLAQLSSTEAVDEVLMLSSTQHVIGGSMSNVFFANEAGLFTPDLRDCGVAGIMRRLVLETARSSRIDGATALTIRTVAPDELHGVREAFVTNVRWGVRSIGHLDGRALPSDDYAQQLRRLVGCD